MKRHPIQPMEWVGRVLRFKANPIVEHLLDFAEKNGMDLNELHRRSGIMKATKHDWDQFNMLIGYSVSGCPILDELTGYRVEAKADLFCEKFPQPAEKDVEEKK